MKNAPQTMKNTPQRPPRAWIAPFALAPMQFVLTAIQLWFGHVGPAILLGLCGVVLLIVGLVVLIKERRTYGEHRGTGGTDH